MAEIGLGKGAGAGSFAAGFGKGLSQALVMNRERSDKKDLEAQRQREELFGKLLPIYLQSGVDPADLEPILQQTFPKQFQQAKGGKKGGESPFQKLAGLIGPIMGMHRGTTIESGWPGGPVTMGPGGHVGMDSPEQGGITGMLGRDPGPFGRRPDTTGSGKLGMAPSQQPEGVTGGTLGNRPVYGANQGAFTTQLSPAEETQFQNWVRANNITDVDHPDSFYDYRGYWKEYGNKPIRFGVDHFPDTYKQPGHPTFSVESKYAQGRTDAGRWEGEKFIPPTPTGGFAGLLQGAPPDISQTPFGGAQAAPAPQAPAAPAHRTLFGVPMLTEEESAKRAGRRAGIAEGAKTEAELQAKMDIARRLIAQGMKPSEAYDRAGLRSTTTGATTVRYGGILKGDQAAPGTDDIYGRPLDPNTYYRLQIQPDMSLSYTPTVAPGGNLGVDREAISRAMFGGKSFAQLTAPQQQQVLDAEKKRAGEMSETRALGTEQGQFKAPIDVKTAQETNLPVGTTSADVAGQTVQTSQDRERIQSLNTLKSDLTRVQDLLAVLPSEKSLAGVAPGAVLAARRRMNSASGIKDADGNEMSYRSAMAQLQANVDQMVNVLARVRGEQRGAQTERDAERAYNAVVQLQAGLLDPLGGDTQESAKARITEALAGLERVIQQVPTQAVPQRTPATSGATQPAAAAPSAGPPGITMKNGKLYGPDGKLLPGQ